MTGVRWYVGIPGAGKTTLAATHAAELSQETGWPVACIDSAGVAQLDHIPRAGSLVQLVQRVVVDRQHAAWTPHDENEVNAWCKIVPRAGGLVVLVDEAAFWLSSRRGTQGPLLRLMRAHRHARCWLLLTTQHLSADVPQEALSCAPDLYVFRCTSRAVLERLEGDYNLPPQTVRSLPRGTYAHVISGFPS